MPWYHVHRWIVFWIMLAGVSLGHSSGPSPCILKASDNKIFVSCARDLQAYMDERRSIVNTDKQGIDCSKRFQNMMTCMHRFSEQYECPEIYPSPLPSIADLQRACQPGSIYCRDPLISCFFPAQPHTFGGSTPFSLFQYNVGTICSPAFSDSIRCLEKVKEECMVTDDSVEKNNVMEDLLIVQHFTKTGCKHIPKDFSNNTCVEKHVNSEEFMKCYKKVFEKYGQTSCESYVAGKECLRQNVEVPCGYEYSYVFYITTHLFIRHVPRGCEPLVIILQTNSNLLNTTEMLPEPPSTNIAPSNEKDSPSRNGGKMISFNATVFVYLTIYFCLSLKLSWKWKQD